MARNIEVLCYLVINSRGRVKATRHKPPLAMDEVAVRIQMNLPEMLFARPQLQASLTVKEDAVSPHVITPEVLISTKELLERGTGMSVELRVVPPEKED